jgi:hypothetical protein
MSRRDGYLSPRSRTCRFDNRKKSFSTVGLSSLPVTLWLLQLVLSPLLEELLFRGFVMKELLALLPVYLAIALTSLLFVGVHLPYWLSHGGATRAMMTKAGGVFCVQRCGLLAVCKDRIDLATNSRARRKQRLADNVAREQCLVRARTLHCSGRAPASRHPPLSSSVERPLCRTSSGSSGAETHIG